ncbi:hypothetical protein ACFC58_40700 [Kitasatospora purpeofusca]|uniref:hypothetical protein n=1 Tax=Kitasatospora purpeofusca TaxID=67352 RepID=UPI0035D7B508
MNRTVTSTDPGSVRLATTRRRADERQAADLERTRAYYAMEGRPGIRAEPGGRIRHDGHEDTIVETAGQRLNVLLDGDEAPTGWITAKPVPDPRAPAPTGA